MGDKIVKYTVVPMDSTAGYDAASLQETLNLYGREGWELWPLPLHGQRPILDVPYLVLTKTEYRSDKPREERITDLLEYVLTTAFRDEPMDSDGIAKVKQVIGLVLDET